MIGVTPVIHAGDGYFFYYIQPEYLTPDPNTLDVFRTLLSGPEFR